MLTEKDCKEILSTPDNMKKFVEDLRNEANKIEAKVCNDLEYYNELAKRKCRYFQCIIMP